MMVTAPPIFQVGHLERMPLGTPYPGIVAHVGRLLGKFPARTELVIDVTGVGKPVFEMFTYSGISPLGVLITAGTAETRDGVICGVPKLTLVSRLQALLHQGRLKIHRELAEAETLRGKISFPVVVLISLSRAANSPRGHHHTVRRLAGKCNLKGFQHSLVENRPRLLGFVFRGLDGSHSRSIGLSSGE